MSHHLRNMWDMFKNTLPNVVQILHGWEAPRNAGNALLFSKSAFQRPDELSLSSATFLFMIFGKTHQLMLVMRLWTSLFVATHLTRYSLGLTCYGGTTIMLLCMNTLTGRDFQFLKLLFVSSPISVTVVEPVEVVKNQSSVSTCINHRIAIIAWLYLHPCQTNYSSYFQ